MLLFSSYLVSDSLPPGGLQHASLLCPPLSPGICSNPCPASQQRYLTILCRSLLLLTSIFPSTRVFSIKSALWIRQPKYWSFSFSISPSNEYSELISFRMDWLDLLAVQETLKSLLQHHSSKASIFRHSAFLIVQLSHPYVTTVKKPQLWLDRPQCNPLENSSWGYLLYPRSNLAHLVLCLLLGRALSPEEEEESVKELRTSSFLEKNQESYLCIW